MGADIHTSAQYDVGGLLIRAPCGAVGHGGHYHSQSPEAAMAVPGIKVVIASSPRDAKGLLIASALEPDPVIFFEPKALFLGTGNIFVDWRVPPKRDTTRKNLRSRPCPRKKKIPSC